MYVTETKDISNQPALINPHSACQFVIRNLQLCEWLLCGMPTPDSNTLVERILISATYTSYNSQQLLEQTIKYSDYINKSIHESFDCACKWKLRLYAWACFFFVEPQLDRISMTKEMIVSRNVVRNSHFAETMNGK